MRATLELGILIHLHDIDRKKWHTTGADVLRSFADKIEAAHPDFSSEYWEIKDDRGVCAYLGTNRHA